MSVLLEEELPAAELQRKDTQTVSISRGPGEQAQPGDSLALEPYPSSGPLSQLRFGFSETGAPYVARAIFELTISSWLASNSQRLTVFAQGCRG